MASTTKKHNHTAAATAQPKMYVYDLTGIGNRTPEYHPTKVVTKKPSSKGYIWGFTKSLKPSTKTKTNEFDPKQGNKSSVFGTGRKSVSNVDECIVKEEEPRRASITTTFEESKPVRLIEGRKSVSHVEKTYEVDSKQGRNRGNEEVNKSSVLVTGRKSVSDVEEYIVKEEEPRRASITTSFEETKPPRFIEGRKSMSNVEKQRRVRNSFAIEAELMQVKVLVSDMPGFMQLHAFRCARKTFDSLEKFSAKHLAFNLKKEFDQVYGPAWHCIVGSSFGSFVTHSTGCFLYFSLEKLYILLFKTKVRKALE